MIASLRLAVLLLVLANVLVGARAFLASPTNPDAGRIEQQLLPEKVKVIAFADAQSAAASKDNVQPSAEAQPLAEMQPTTEVQPAEETCQFWSDLANPDADQVERLLAEQFPAFKAMRQVTAETNGYWVFVPPLESKEEANRKTAELQQLGVQDFFILHASGPNQFAISLGTYRTEEAANAGLEALRAKGVKSAKVGERKGKPINSFEIRGPQPQAEMLRQAMAALLPKSNSTACPDGKEETP
jgi:hypothetical protein